MAKGVRKIENRIAKYRALINSQTPKALREEIEKTIEKLVDEIITLTTKEEK